MAAQRPSKSVPTSETPPGPSRDGKLAVQPPESAQGKGAAGVARSSRARSPSRQAQTVLAVFPESRSGNRAYEALESAVRDMKHTRLERLTFEKLDYGETASLDRFYAASVAVVDVSERTMQAAMFYHLGLRENFGMKNNVVTCQLDADSSFGPDETGPAQPSIPVSV